MRLYGEEAAAAIAEDEAEAAAAAAAAAADRAASKKGKKPSKKDARDEKRGKHPRKNKIVDIGEGLGSWLERECPEHPCLTRSRSKENAAEQL